MYVDNNIENITHVPLKIPLLFHSNSTKNPLKNIDKFIT